MKEKDNKQEKERITICDKYYEGNDYNVVMENLGQVKGTVLY